MLWKLFIMRKLRALCRRLARLNIGFYAVTVHGHRYFVHKSLNRNFFPSFLVFEGDSVNDVEEFLSGCFLED